MGDVSGDPDGVRVATGFSASRSDDDFTYLDPDATAAAGSDVFKARQNAGHAAVAGLASVGVPVRAGSEAGALTVTALAQARRQRLPGAVDHPTPYQRLDSSRLLSAVELTLPMGSGVVGVRGWGRREDLSVRDDPDFARATLGPSQTGDAIIAAGGSAGWRARPTEETTIEVRVDGSAERFAPGSWIGAVAPPGARRTSAGLGLDAKTRAAAATLAASARADGWVDASDDGQSGATARPTGNLGVEVPLGPLPVIAASHAGFVARPPSFVELYGNRGAFVGDTGLKSESAFTVDAGARTTERLGPVRLHVDVAGFATWASDLITYVYVGAEGKARATNIGEARIAGIEAEMRATAWGFEARASHTALATTNESAFGHPPLPGRPAQDFVGDLSFTRGPVRVRYGVDVVSGIFADLSGSIQVPARVIHGAGATVAIPFAPGLSMTLDVRNLFDLRAAEYAGVLGPVRAPIGDVYDYPLPGRRVLVSARFVFPP
jgi:hypothetical protein